MDFDVLPDGRVTGHVVWEGFAGMDHFDRQDKLRTVLPEELSDDARKVGIMLTYTPTEMRAMDAA